METLWDIEAGLRVLESCNGIPYLHQGRDANGMDCIGPVLAALHAAGWEASNPKDTYQDHYPPEGSWPDIQKVLDSEGYVIPKGEALPLDVLLIHWKGQGIPQHFAMINKVSELGMWITHTHESLERVASLRVTGPLERRVFCYFRFRGRVLNDPLDTNGASLRHSIGGDF